MARKQPMELVIAPRQAMCFQLLPPVPRCYIAPFQIYSGTELPQWPFCGAQNGGQREQARRSGKQKDRLPPLVRHDPAIGAAYRGQIQPSGEAEA